MDKENVVHIYSGLLLSHNAVTWMDLKMIILSYMQNLKYDTNKPIYKTETDSQT